MPCQSKESLLFDPITQSNSYFLFNRSLFMGNFKDRHIQLVIYSLMLTCIIFYLSTVFIYVQQFYSSSIAVFPIVLFFIALYNMLATSFKDPGIVPKKNYKHTEVSELCLMVTIEQSHEQEPCCSPLDSVALYQKRECNTCFITRQPLTSHCSHCNHCILVFDHHCFIFGNCVGIRNYRNFVLALLFLTIDSFYHTLFSLHLFHQQLSAIQLTPLTLPYYQTLSSATFYILLFIFIVQGIPLKPKIQITFIVTALTVLFILLVRLLSQCTFEVYYHNPIYNFLLLIFILGVQCYSVPFAYINCSNVTKNKTTKQLKAIQDYIDNNQYENDKQDDVNQVKKTLQSDWKQKLRNIYTFLTYSYPPSQL